MLSKIHDNRCNRIYLPTYSNCSKSGRRGAMLMAVSCSRGGRAAWEYGNMGPDVLA